MRSFNEYFGLLLFNIKNNLSILLKAQISCPDAKLKKELSGFGKDLNLSYQQLMDLGDYYLVTNFINRQKMGFCSIKKECLNPYSEISIWSYSITVFGGLLALFITAFSFRTMVLQKPTEIRLTWQLLFLFLVSNLITIHIMHVIGSDYLFQLKSSMLKTSFFQSNRYLQQIDELFVSEKTLLQSSIEKSKPELIAGLKAGIFNKNSISAFLAEQKPEPYLFCFIASGSNYIGGSQENLSDGNIIEADSKGLGQDRIKLGGIKAIQKMGSFVLNWLNKTPVSVKSATEIEYIGKSLFQKQPHELVQLIFSANEFWEWQLGKRKVLTYVDFFRFFDQNLNDYLLWITWHSYDIQLDFVRRLFFQLNRNELGIKVFAVDERIENAFPPNALENKVIKDFALKLRDRTPSRYELCRFEDKDYLLSGYKCIEMDNIRLLSLFPLEKIDKAVSAKKMMLLKFVSISFLISIFLGLAISDSILKPLSALQKGMMAIQERDFSHRIPELGKDEFGNLANLFNETLVDLEEMSVAQLLHDKIMTDLSEPIQYSEFKIFGQTLNLSGMGGDYFEEILTPLEKPAFIIGAVSGRGVSTSLVLAFIKSATMQLYNQADSSETFLKKLNWMLLKSSKTNNLKKFSCQYLVFSSDYQITFANAGLPHPIIVDRKKRTFHSLEITSLPLGCIKDFSPAIATINLEKGQSLVCFSDGFLNHWQIDYDQIAKIVAESSSENPKDFCSGCFSKYFDTIGKDFCKEDLSILVVNRNE